MAETQFLLFFIFRPWPKACFRCFLLVGHGRKPFFTVFSVSAAADELFRLFPLTSSADNSDRISLLPPEISRETKATDYSATGRTEHPPARLPPFCGYT